MDPKEKNEEKMRKPRFKIMIAGVNGWSKWVYPTPEKNYLFKCCDCGLVHEMQFETFLERNRRRGTFQIFKLPKEIRAMFRARRLKE